MGGPKRCSGDSLRQNETKSVQEGGKGLRGILFTAALLLVICFFLPAVRSCGTADYPYQFPFFALPYLFGLMTACLIFLRPSFARYVIQLVFSFILMVGQGSLIHFFLYDDYRRVQIETKFIIRDVLILALFWGTAGAHLWAFFKKKDWNYGLRSARVLWASAMFCLLWFSLWVVANPLYGLWLSILSSGILVMGGFYLERSLQSQKSG